jgi:kynureninase
VNLFKLVWAALTMQSDRSKLVTDELNFPSDLYIMQGILKNHPGRFQLDLLESHDGISVHPDEMDKKIDGHTALVSLSHVSFKSAFMYDMHAVTSRVHSQGAMVLWDLSHAAGAVPVDLNGSGADMAVGCTYKYLNGGPGSPAYLYVRKDLQERLQPPIWGWFGVSNPFDFSLEFDPSGGIRRFLVGSPPILSMIPVETGLKMIREAGMDRIREKSLAQSEFIMKMVTKVLLEQGFTIGSPRKPGQRGSHVSLRHPEGYRICQALADPDEGAYTILPDFREPDHIRIGIAPLYNTFEELVIVVQELKRIVENRIYEKYSIVRETVT